MIKLLPYFIVVLISSCSKNYYADEMKIADSLLKENLQLMEVKTNHIPDTKGTMYLYERKSAEKEFILIDSFPVMIGKNGFAWDNASPFKFGSQRIKHEGDGCSPAGIFNPGKVFSYHAIENLKMPFIQVDENDLCVDDMNSIYYNQLIDSEIIETQDYNSYEHMKRSDDLYEYGVWVNYNTTPINPGNGSCIFLHIWRDENSPTSGCTAMSKENMLKLINWLDKKKNPVLVQYSSM